MEKETSKTGLDKSYNIAMICHDINRLKSLTQVYPADHRPPNLTNLKRIMNL